MHILKLNKHFFGLSRDTIIGFNYCVPSNSTFITNNQYEPFEELEKELGSLAPQGDFILLVDYNARCQTRDDFINSINDSDIPEWSDLAQLFPNDTIATSPRQNIDPKFNTYGGKLIDLCKSVPLRLLNGRKCGDLLGFPTCYTPNGFSTVDYGMVSPSLYDKVDSFNVGDPEPTLSDHVPITINLKIKNNINKTQIKYNFYPKPSKIIWNKDKSAQYLTLLQAPACKEMLNDFSLKNLQVTQATIDSATTFLSDIMVNTAVVAEMLLKVPPTPKSSMSKSEKYHIHLGMTSHAMRLIKKLK